MALLGVGWRHGTLFLVGGLLSATLYHAAFGFTAAYRNAVVCRDVSSTPTQLLMLAAAGLLSALILAEGQVFGRDVVLGRFTAAGLAGCIQPILRISPRSLSKALIGGVWMG